MSQGHEEDEEPTLDSPGGSPEMDSATKHGLENTQSTSSPEYLTIHASDGRVVTRISAGTQTDWRHEEEENPDYKYYNVGTSKAPHKNVGIAYEQSVPKNMKSELEISPDNEVLDSFSEETPRAPAACPGEPEESLTNLDKISSSSGSDSSEEKLQTVLNIRCEHCQQPEEPPVTSHQIANSVDPQEVFCCEKARNRDPAMRKDQRLKGVEYESSDPQTPQAGRLAILVSAAQSADWCCVLVLEDKHPQPCIQAVFTTEGQATCYHNNGCIWVNLSPWGGTYCSDTGGLKKHWDWLDKEQHVHAPPYRTLALTLSPNLNIRIQSQEHICIAFTSGKRSIQLNVGAKLKLNQGKGLTLPGLDMLQRYLQQKSAEINALLQNIQSLIPDQKTVSPRKVKPQPSLISQTERRQLPMKQQQSAKKTPKADDGHLCEVTQTVLFTSFDFKCFQ
ncbi:glutamate-rich protein 6-like isoform X4 [Gymnodraco acuticeps]|uniref:Glutamate-rich protein 6-like isoform X4 n=1 Tax=Gymnodraco acuticeps TaxID=8218 RepID=A0A6P8TXS7_GYMAC|nr:glutamate-rich protein 6-like isoform X4 [Gymnodraco acuticeps]